MKRFFDFAIFCILLLSSHLVFAKSKAALDLKFSSLSFADTNTQSFNFQAESHFLHKFEKGPYSTGLKFGLFAASYPDFNFQVPELFGAYKLSKQSEISFGRRNPIEELHLDSDWGLSVLQSSFRMEPLSPEIQGLSGLHYGFRSENFFFYGMVSPVSIPDQAQSISRSGEEITSSNPWASLPPEFIDLNGSTSTLSYDIQNDSLPELLSKVQFGASLGLDIDNVRVSAFYYYKPSRQLSFRVRAQGTNQNDDVIVRADVTPQFLQEHLYGLQAKLDWLPNLTTKHGAYGVLTDDDDLDANQDYQTEINNYFIFSNSINYRWRKGSFGLSHIHFNEREVVSDERISIDYNKYIHGSAVKLSSSYKLTPKSLFKAVGLYDYDNKGVSISSSLEYKYSKTLTAWSELQVLQDIGEETSNSIFERFEGLDSVRIGVKLVF